MSKIKEKFFKASKESYGDNSVRYGSSELRINNPNYEDIKYGYDWGSINNGSKLLASSMLKEVGSAEIARIYTNRYTENVINKFHTDSWSMSAIDVAKWINENTTYKVHEDELAELENEDKLAQEKEERRIKREKEFHEMAKKRMQQKENEKKEAQFKGKENRVNNKDELEELKKEISVQQAQIDKYKNEIANLEKELITCKKFLNQLDISALYKEYTKN